MIDPANNLAVANGSQADQPAGLAGPQRSVIDSILYTFPEAVTVEAGAFSITNLGPVPSSVPTLTAMPVQPPTISGAAWGPASGSSSMYWSVTFSGHDVDNGDPESDITGLSIGTGVYEIDANPAYIIKVSDSEPIATQTQRDFFFRFFGDLDGTDSVAFNAGSLLVEDAGHVPADTGLYDAALDPTGTGAEIVYYSGGELGYDEGTLINLPVPDSGFTI